MAGRDEIIAFCDELLESESFADYGPNGLQVPGSREVVRVATGVSASRELLERAVAARAQLALVHHGLFWDGAPRSLSDPLAARLRVALEAQLSLAAYHLPLDAHPELGNNALLCRELGFEPERRFAEVKGRPIGMIGRSPEALSAEELAARVTAALGREPLHFDEGPDRIRSLGVVTGAGSGSIHEAIDLGLDAFLTGEPAEPAMADSREGGIHYLAAGHYATEIGGVRRLGELLGDRFGVEVEFVELPNPI